MNCLFEEQELKVPDITVFVSIQRVRLVWNYVIVDEELSLTIDYLSVCIDHPLNRQEVNISNPLPVISSKDSMLKRAF